MSKDIILTVDYHDENCVIRRRDEVTGEETVQTVATTAHNLEEAGLPRCQNGLFFMACFSVILTNLVSGGQNLALEFAGFPGNRPF
jgi:hypothetical protein